MKDTTNLEVLSTRAGFNAAVRHMNKAIELAGEAEAANLGDLLYERGDESLSGERAALLLRMILTDKLRFKAVSTNLRACAADLPALAAEFARWKAVDLVAAYHHPDLGLLTANPKRPEQLSLFGALRKRELLVVYAGKAGAEGLCEKAAKTALLLFEGGKVKIPAEVYKGDRESGIGNRESTPRLPTPDSRLPAPDSRSPITMTPLYSVAVQNELFHNGNVEAWKRIIASYNAKYPDLLVYIYYEGERILDINALFQWGKVKHGSAIQFAVAGRDIRDVAKLQRYLLEGASSRFEAFLKGPVNSTLRLF